MAVIPLLSSPGVQRDGTLLASTAYTDAQWCRWQRGLPRKMGGYKNTQPYLVAVSRALYSQAQSGYRYIYSGTPTTVDQFTIDNTGVASAVVNPSIPATTFPTTAGLPVGLQSNSWQFESQFDNNNGVNMIFAHCAQNLLDPANASNFPLYAASIYSPTAWNYVGPNGIGTGAKTGFVQIPGNASGSDGHGGTLQALFPNGISGGIVSLQPYMIVYGNDGFFAWSTPGYPTDFIGATLGQLYVGATQITNQKIIKGLPLRGGGGYSPAGLFWSVDSVVRATFVGIPNGTWQFDQLTTQSSILSDRSVIENDGKFYWAGVDRFLMYNGVIQEVPNQMNINWFFDNINPAAAGKSFCMKIPRYGEIWWCYPRGTNTECSHAVIYNFRENLWYDTALPTDLRSSGLHADNFVGNIMGSPTPYTYITLNGSGVQVTNTAYNLWRHEQGLDQIYIQNAQQNAVLSSFTTAPICAINNPQQPSDAMTSIQQLVPDFLQTGDMTCTVLKQNNMAAPSTIGSVVAIKQPNPALPLNQTVPLKDTAKILRLQISSNTLGGNYQAGKSIVTIQTDGERDT